MPYQLMNNAYTCEYSPYNEGNYPVSNIRYDGDRLKVNANVNSTGMLCFAGGVAVGALVAYYLINKCKEQ